MYDGPTGNPIFESVEFDQGVWERFKKSRPTDIISTSIDDFSKFIRLTQAVSGEIIDPATGEASFTIPSDIIFMGTIPLTDVEFELSYPGGTFSARVVIFPDCRDGFDMNVICDQMGGSDWIAEVGAVVFSDKKNTDACIYIVFTISPHDCIGLNTAVYSNRLSPDAKYRILSDPVMFERLKELVQQLQQILVGWYGIQICLLNPLTKDVFTRNTRSIPVDSDVKRRRKNKNKNAKIRYVKKHIIRAEDADELIKPKGHNQRHTLVWYVTGHWRQCKSGKKVFIKGHWKGLLRESKSGETRDREVILTQEGDRNDTE